MMRTYLLTDVEDMLVGFRLAGVDGELVKATEVLDVIREKIKDKTIGTLILSRKLFKAHENEILDIKLKSKQVMIVAIPGAGEAVESDLEKYIRDSIGVKL